jgi:hypothetical protein
MSRKLQKNLVVLGIGSAAALAIGVASAHDRATGHPARQAVQPAQSDPTALGMGGAGRAGTGGASDAGTRRRGKGGKKGGDGGMMMNGDGGMMRGGMGDGGMMRGRGGRGGRDGGGGGGGGGGDRDAG